jgi:hypothetical protein
MRTVDDSPGAEMVLAPESNDFAAQGAGTGERIETGNVNIRGRHAEDQIAHGAAHDIGIRGKAAQARKEAEEIVFQDLHFAPAVILRLP